jgi:hypothetical protein
MGTALHDILGFVSSTGSADLPTGSSGLASGSAGLASGSASGAFAYFPGH